MDFYFIYDINNWKHIINKLLLLEDLFKEEDKLINIYIHTSISTVSYNSLEKKTWESYILRDEKRERRKEIVAI